MVFPQRNTRRSVVRDGRTVVASLAGRKKNGSGGGRMVGRGKHGQGRKTKNTRSADGDQADEGHTEGRLNIKFSCGNKLLFPLTICSVRFLLRQFTNSIPWNLPPSATNGPPCRHLYPYWLLTTTSYYY